MIDIHLGFFAIKAIMVSQQPNILEDIESGGILVCVRLIVDTSFRMASKLVMRAAGEQVVGRGTPQTEEVTEKRHVRMCSHRQRWG